MIKTNALSVKTIESYAKKFRKEFKVKDDEYFPILDVLDELTNKNLLTYQIVEDDYHLMSEETQALYSCNENYLYIKESVIEDYENNIYHSCFTLCHELFHYIQNKVLNFKFEEVENCKSYEDVEWQANEFAGQILIPTQYLDYDEYKLSEMFHVTIECALTRKLKSKKRKKK